MHQFTVHQEGIKNARRKVIIPLVIIYATLLTIVITIALPHSEDDPTVSTWPFMVVLFTGIIGFSVFRTINKQKRILESYKLTIDENNIIREILNTPKIVITKAEVKEIRKNNNGTFTIIGNSRLNAIGIPAGINDIALLEQLLNSIKPLTIKTSKGWQRHLWLIGIAAVALAFYAFSANDPLISSLGGLAFGAIMIYSFVIIQRSKNIDNRTKRSSYIVLIVALLIMTGVVLRLLEH